MRRFLKKKTVWLTAAAVILIGCISIGPAMAYFTTYTKAAGSQTISLGSSTTIRETFSNWTKHIMIDNTGENPCYVRVKVIAGSQFTINYTDSTGNWYDGGDGYWYCKQIVPVGGSTAQLDAKITVPDSMKTEFNVVVVQECTGVLYDANGNPYADWTQKIDTTTGISGEGAGE